MRREILWAAVGLGLCAADGCARADQVVLSPLSAGQYSNDQHAQEFNIQVPSGFRNPPYFNVLAAGGDAYSRPFDTVNVTLARYVGSVEYSLASVPANAVITSATLTYTGGPYGALGTPPVGINITMHDGGDGVVTALDVDKTPKLIVGSQVTDTTRLYTTALSNLSFLNDRLADLPSGYLGLDFELDHTVTTAGSAQLAYVYLGPPSYPPASPPVLTLTFVTVPEPASMGVLGLGVMMLLRRRR